MSDQPDLLDVPADVETQIDRAFDRIFVLHGQDLSAFTERIAPKEGEGTDPLINQEARRLLRLEHGV